MKKSEVEKQNLGIFVLMPQHLDMSFNNGGGLKMHQL